MKTESQYSKSDLSEVDKVILDGLKASANPKSTYVIAKESKISWSTANSHCYKLKSMGIIKSAVGKSKAGSGKKMMWWL
ncbi:Uncharacterised protein [uncultured archaeon]|nr:Uncharacterised protein [uncultured archaeon]